MNELWVELSEWVSGSHAITSSKGIPRRENRPDSWISVSVWLKMEIVEVGSHLGAECEHKQAEQPGEEGAGSSIPPNWLWHKQVKKQRERKNIREICYRAILFVRECSRVRQTTTFLLLSLLCCWQFKYDRDERKRLLRKSHRHPHQHPHSHQLSWTGGGNREGRKRKKIVIFLLVSKNRNFFQYFYKTTT